MSVSFISRDESAWTPSSPDERVIVPPSILIASFECIESSEESISIVPPEIITPVTPFIPLALSEVSLSVDVVVDCIPQLPQFPPLLLLALELPPPDVIVISPPVISTVVSAWIPSVPAVIFMVPPSITT